MAAEPSPDRAKVAFPSEAYTLTSEQEQRLLDHCFQRLSDLENELGRDQVKDEYWWRDTSAGGARRRARTWMGKRMSYELTYDNDVEWREHALGGIFEESNWIVPISRRVVQQQVARANAYFFGTDPWFAVDAQGTEDEALARSSDRWVRHKFREGKVRHRLEAAVERAFIRGECVVKHVHRKSEDIYQAPMVVLIDPQTKEPLRANDGEVITETDVWVPGTTPTGAPTEILARDGVTMRPQGEFLKYEKRLIPRRVTRFDGPEVSDVYFKDFLCPLAAPTVQDADLCVHLYDEPVAAMVDRYRRATLDMTMNGGTPDTSPESTQAAVAAFQAMSGNTGHRHGEGAAGIGAGSTWRPEREEDVAGSSLRGGVGTVGGPDSAVARLAEFWVRFDADGDGIMEHLVVIVDRETKTPIYYEHVANVTPSGLRPFSVIRINPVPARWYGSGSMQAFEQLQTNADLQYNRRNFSQTRAGRIDLFRPYNTLEGATNPDLEINWGGTLTPIEGKKAEDVIESVYLNDIKSGDLLADLEFILQLAMNLSGVAHANDLAAAGADSAKTATGTLNVDKAGHEMFGQLISHLEEGVGDAAQAAADLALMHMAPEETYKYFNGETAIFDKIQRGELDSLKLDIRLTLTRHRAEQQMESGQRASTIAQEFYALMPGVQAIVAPLYRQILRALQVADADTIIQPMLPLAPPTGPWQDLDGAIPAQTAPHGLNGEAQAPPAPADQFAPQMEGGAVGGVKAQGG